MIIFAFVQNMGFFEWLVVFAIVFVVFRRSVARSLGQTVGTYTANPQQSANSSAAPKSSEPLARYFSALDLPATATPQQIKDSYRELVKVWHPDRFGDEKLKERANAKLKEINEAYEKLSAAYHL
jgi:DnaJ-domain-containing protein 1